MTCLAFAFASIDKLNEIGPRKTTSQLTSFLSSKFMNFWGHEGHCPLPTVRSGERTFLGDVRTCAFLDWRQRSRVYATIHHLSRGFFCLCCCCFFCFFRRVAAATTAQQHKSNNNSNINRQQQQTAKRHFEATRKHKKRIRIRICSQLVAK